MTIVGAYEAKTRLSELLERAEKGERFVITRHGKPIAEIIPASAHDRRRAAEAMAELREIAAANELPGLSWDDLKALRDQGRPGCD